MLIRKDVTTLALPIITEQTFVMLMGVINAIMASRIGKDVVSAIGMVDSINNIFISFFSALAVGGTVVVAHYIGRNNSSDANEAARHALYSSLILSIIIAVLLFVFGKPIMNLLFGSAEAGVISNTLIYLNITLSTYPFIAVTAVACGVLRGAGDTKTPMKVIILMNLINIILSYVLIYGIRIVNTHFSIIIPKYGIRGAAFGIGAARAIGAVLIIYSIFAGSKAIKLRVIHEFKINTGHLRSIFGVGFPASVESLLFNGGKLITQIFIVGMGTASIAANYIAGSIANLINIPGSALSVAATTLVGRNIGSGEKKEAKSVLIYLTKLSSLCLLVICIVIYPSAKFLISMYTGSTDVIDITVILIKSLAIATPLLWSVAFLIPAGLKGAGDAKYTMIISIISMWLFRVFSGYVLGVLLKMGALGIWLGMYLDWVVRTFMFTFRLRGDKWTSKKVIKAAKSRIHGTNID